MRRKITSLKISIFIACLFAISVTTTAQIKIKPAILDIGTDFKNEFVLVIKANEKFEKPERVVKSDFKADDTKFDPYKMSSYPKWKFNNMSFLNNDATITRYISLYCATTNKYLQYKSGGVQMIDQSEFDKIMKKNEKNEYINSTDVIMQFYFKPIVDGEYIQLGIYNTEGKNLVVTQMDWDTRLFKLVLCD